MTKEPETATNRVPPASINAQAIQLESWLPDRPEPVLGGPMTGLGVADAVGDGIGDGAGDAVGDGVGDGVGEGVGDGVGDGVSD